MDKIQEIRHELIRVINTFAPITLTELTDVLAYVLIDIGTSALDMTKVTVEDIELIVNKQEFDPTLAGALITQAVLMLKWQLADMEENNNVR